MKMKSLKVCRQSVFYSQIPQSMNIYYSLLNREKDGFNELHVPVLCRDYFNDALVSAYTDNDVPEIYGFKLQDKRMDLENILMSVYVNTAEESLVCNPTYSVVSPEKTPMDNFIFNLKILNNLEALMKIRKTKIYLTDKTLGQEDREKYKAVIVEGSKAWLTSVPLLSLYTFILRCMCYNVDEVGKEYPTTLAGFLNRIVRLYPCSQDSSYIKTYERVDLDFLCKNYKKIFKNNPLTGFNDALLNNNSYFFSSSFEEHVGLTIKELKIKGVFSMYRIHNTGGILNLGKLIDCIKNRYDSKTYLNSDSYLTQVCGVSFALSYLEQACKKVGCTLKTMPNEFPKDLLNYEGILNSSQT